MKKAAVVFATHSGNAELVAEAVADGLNESKIDVNCIRSEQTKALDLLSYDCVVLVCSTYDVGKLNDKMIKLNLEILAEGKKFGGRHFEVVGLGDSYNYDIFCGAADILENTVKSVGGVQKFETVRFDGYPHSQLADFKKWGKELAEKI